MYTGVSINGGIPKNGRFIVENLNLKWMYIISHRFLAMVTSIHVASHPAAPPSISMWASNSRVKPMGL